MDITLLYFDDCPNWKTTNQRLEKLRSDFDFDITLVKVETTEDAERLAFRGSPTILINGDDPFARPNDPIGLTCRIYQTPAGIKGSPTTEMLRSALQRSDDPDG